MLADSGSMPAVTSQRPLGAALASALLAVAGLAGVMTGPYLVALGIWLAREETTSDRWIILATETIVGLGVLAVGIGAFATARAFWRGSAWAWPAAMFLALSLLAGMALLALLDEWVAPYALVVVLGVLLVAALLPASVRRAYGL